MKKFVTLRQNFSQMGTFFKTFFACILAIIVSSIVNFLFLMLVVSVLLSSSEQTFNLKSNSVLRLDLGMTMTDGDNTNPFESIDFKSMTINKNLSVYQVVSLIEQAQNDSRIKGIYIDIPMSTPNSVSKLYEIRQALKKFKENSSKFIIAYGDAYSQGGYYVASCADKIYLNPQGGMDWSGMSSTSLFFKGALDKLGIEPEIIRYGKFKGAVEPFMLDKMSSENRKQMQELLASVWNFTVGEIAQSRGIDTAQLQTYANNLSIQSPYDALKYKMVDSLYYKDQLLDEIAKLTDEKTPSFVSMSQYSSVYPLSGLGSILAGDRVGVIYATGEIVDGGDGQSMIIGNKLAKEIRDIRKDSTIKAVVLRVNSPGGSVLASDIIWREVELTRSVKPVVVSMGDYAASGGYYISCPADEIITTPTTITGSIGVFGMMFNVEKAAREKLGVTADVVKTNPNADLGNMFRPLSSFERRVMQSQVDSVYIRFVNLVAQGRDLTFDNVDQMAQGRVWSGMQAIDNGLADKIGTLQDAIHIAADRAALTDYRVEFFPKADESFSMFVNMLTQSSVKYLKSTIGIFPQLDQAAELIRKYEGVKARIPFEVEIQ